MKKILVVVDIQKDFVDGSLGTKEAVAIIPNAVKKIGEYDNIIVTFDNHSEDYLSTNEGKNLPVIHCVEGTNGWQLNDDIKAALAEKDYISVKKPAFGSVKLPELVAELAGKEAFSVELIGLCTDICVVSNALLLKANFPEAEISVDSSCCAGVTPELHEAALNTMRSCQINIK